MSCSGTSEALRPERRVTPIPVLIVDDDPDIRILIGLLVRGQAGLIVVGEAVSAVEALELARTTRPRIIVLDHSLDGDVTGLEAAAVLKAAAPGAKILLFTAYDMAPDVEAEAAVDGFLRKDRVGELREAIERLLAS